MAKGITEVLRQDHDEVRSMLARIEVATGDHRRDLFHELVGELIRHEVAEEEIVRPVSKQDAGAAVANARIKEESEAEELLKEMEKLDPSSGEFAEKFSKLRAEVEKHAAAEERDEFPKIEQAQSAERLESMANAYEAAKKLAPTRPHPSTPNTATANLLVGPIAAVVDRARDAIRAALESS